MEDKKKNETRQSTMQNRMENMNGQKPKTISIVISVYNEEKALHEFYREATPVFEALPWNYELIFVNDGSADASGQILAELAAADPRVSASCARQDFHWRISARFFTSRAQHHFICINS